jgi:hypothetical protein
MPSRRTASIIWWVLFAGAILFAAVATVVGPGFWQAKSEVAPILSWVALAMAALDLLLSRLLPSRVKAVPGAAPEAVALTRTIVASAMNEGSALFAGVAWMVGGDPLALVALAISLAGLLLAFPSLERWRRLGGSPERAERANRLVR